MTIWSSNSALIRTFVAACGFANAKARGFRSRRLPRRGGFRRRAARRHACWSPAAIATRSSSPRSKTTILYPVRGRRDGQNRPAEVRARYGVEPKQVPDFIALRGDPSDKLPGAPGVGATGAAALLRQIRQPRRAPQGRALCQTGGEFAALTAQLPLMDKKAPLPSVARQKPTWEKAAALAKKWRLVQLAARLEEMERSK